MSNEGINKKKADKSWGGFFNSMFSSLSVTSDKDKSKEAVSDSSKSRKVTKEEGHPRVSASRTSIKSKKVQRRELEEALVKPDPDYKISQSKEVKNMKEREEFNQHSQKPSQMKQKDRVWNSREGKRAPRN